MLAHAQRRAIAKPGQATRTRGPKPFRATSTTTVAKPDLKLWKPINITKANLVESQGGESTRNIDGVVYYISYDAAKDEVVVVDRKLGVRYPAMVDDNSRVRIDTSSPIPHAVAGFSADALKPVLAGNTVGAEVINARAAMVGYFGIVATELVTGQSALQQLTSPVGALAAVALAVATLAASVAPAVAGKVPAAKVIADENDSFADRNLPYVWNALAEKVNGRVAMVGVVSLVLIEQFVLGGRAMFGMF